MSTTRTQVAIVGAGPSGLLLGQLLFKAGIDAVIGADLNGPFYASRAVLPMMRERRAGLIIQISSWAGRYVSRLTGPAGNLLEYWGGAAGTMVLANPANDFVGNVQINTGTISVASIGNVGVASHLGAGNGSGTIVFTRTRPAPGGSEDSVRPNVGDRPKDSRTCDQADSDLHSKSPVNAAWFAMNPSIQPSTLFGSAQRPYSRGISTTHALKWFSATSSRRSGR
jgi:autotransporter-associated beta strand protein